jgi:hypothetical protein
MEAMDVHPERFLIAKGLKARLAQFLHACAFGFFNPSGTMASF